MKLLFTLMTDCNNFVLKRIGTYDFTGNHLGKGNFAYVELAINRVTKSKVCQLDFFLQTIHYNCSQAKSLLLSHIVCAKQE